MSTEPEPLCNAVGTRYPGVLSEDQRVRKTRCLLPLHHEGDHEDRYAREQRLRDEAEQRLNTGEHHAG